MPATLVHARSFYRHPTTGRRVPVSQEKAYRAWYRKRYKGRRTKRENWLFTTDGAPATKKIRGQKYMRVAPDGPLYRIQLAYKMTEVEKVLPLSGFTNRHIRETFNKQEVFRKIWDNWGGIIRVIVSGTIPDPRVEGGRRVREIIHLGYHKEHWELQTYQHGARRRISGRELFRRWLVSSISSNLRRRGLRLSNPKESQQREFKLRQELNALQGMTEFVHSSKMGGHIQQIKWKAEAIKKQRKLQQLRGATIRIEKLV
jgi:hypothetical protein